jgi:flagellar FliL protein
MKKILPLILGVLLMGGGYFGYTKFMGGGPVESPVEAQQTAAKTLAEEKKQRKKDRLEGPVVSLGEPFVINLADPGLSAFTKVSISLRVDKGTPMEASAGGHGGGGDAPALEEQTELRDVVIAVIGDKTSDELKSSEGREAVKEELIDVINKDVPKTLALEVFFTDFAIQAAG